MKTFEGCIHIPAVEIITTGLLFILKHTIEPLTKMRRGFDQIVDLTESELRGPTRVSMLGI